MQKSGSWKDPSACAQRRLDHICTLHPHSVSVIPVLSGYMVTDTSKKSVNGANKLLLVSHIDSHKSSGSDYVNVWCIVI